MTILFMGSEAESFLAVGSALVVETSVRRFDANFVRNALYLTGGSNYLTFSSDFNPVNEAWFHFDATFYNDATTIFAITAAGTPVIRFQAVNPYPTTQVHAWRNNAWVTVGSFQNVGGGQEDRHVFDIHVLAAVEGVCEVFADGTRIANITGDFSAAAGMSNIRGYAAAGNNNSATRFSQFIVADEKTIGWKLAVNAPTAAGSNSEWAGTFSDVNEPGINEANFIAGSTADAVMTFARAARAVPEGFKVRELAVVAHARIGDGTGPQGVQPVIRIGGANYAGPAFQLTTGFKPQIGHFTTNPATGQPWTIADAGAATTQFGVKAVA